MFHYQWFFYSIKCCWGGKKNGYLFFKMLVVFYGFPIATPFETERCEDLIAKVFIINFVLEIFGAFHIIPCAFWLNLLVADAWVLQRIDVDSHAVCVSR